MPQGKGTYGSQVGRPPKKKYASGGSVDPFSTKNPDAIRELTEDSEQVGDIPGVAGAEAEGVPTSDAQERSETFAMGGLVDNYKDGGKVITVQHKTAGFDSTKAKFDKTKNMTADQRIAAMKAKRAKADSSKGKSDYQKIKDAMKRHESRTKGKK